MSSKKKVIVPVEENPAAPKFGTAVCRYSKCGKPFVKKRADQTACSTQCRNRGWWERDAEKKKLQDEKA